MKRTFKFCALFICAVLWFNPVGAQQLTKQFTENGTTEKMERTMPEVQKARQSVSELATMPLVKHSDVRKAINLELPTVQTESMLRAYIQNAVKTEGNEADRVIPFMGSASYRTIRFDITGNEVGTPEIIASWLETSVGIAYPGWGAWCDDHFEGWYLAYSTEEKVNYNVGYMAYDLDGDDLLGQYSIPQTNEVRKASMAAYDIPAKKIYALQNVYNETYTAVTDIVMHQAAPLTGEFTEAGHITGISLPVVAMAISKEGAVYVITTEGKLYTVNKETWAATVVGSTGILTDTYNQAAAIDPRTNTLYWAYVEIDPETEDVIEIGVATVNTQTAEANKIETRFYQTRCLASVYYSANPPMAVSPFGLSYDATAKKVKATFMAPKETRNGDALTELKAIHLYSLVNGKLGEEVGKIENPVPGSKYELEVTVLENEGSLSYAIQAEDKAGIVSLFTTAEVTLLNVALPYKNGFEDNETEMMANVSVFDPMEKEGMGRVKEAAHTGEYGYSMTSQYTADYRMLNFEALPVNKGGIYSIAFWAKSSGSSEQNLFYWFNDELIGALQVGTDWQPVQIYYETEIKGQLKFSLCGLSADATYIDDVEITEISSPNVPGLLKINDVAAAGNALSATMNITLPSLAVSDEPLASVTGIVVQYSEDALFEEYKTDTIKAGLTVGETADFSVKVDKAGQYYFRARAYNEYGVCPMYSTYANRSPWLGPKNMPVSMATAMVNDNGSVTVSWTQPALSDEISWSKNGKMTRRLTIDAKSAFKYAQSFETTDLVTYGLSAPKALQIGFVPGSETAKYSLVLSSDGTEDGELFRKEINSAELKEGEWYYLMVDKTVTIDITKQLWVIVEVAESENQGYACAVSENTSAEGKSNKMFYRGQWSTISKLFTNRNGDVLVSLKAEDASTSMDPDKGYKVYRGKMDAEITEYDSLTEVSKTTYTDQTWKDAEFGRYNYAVVAVWNEADATPVKTNVLDKDMEMKVTFEVVSNAGSAESAEVNMLGKGEGKLYTAIADTAGKVVFDKVWRDEYEFEVVLPYHEYYDSTLNLIGDTVIKVSLTELKTAPTILNVAMEGKNVVLEWGVNAFNWEDDVESYDDFAIADIGEYILSEPVAKGGIKDITWANYNVPQSWIVFNPAQTEPAMNLPAASGNKMFMSMYGDGVSNDYLIRSVGMGGGLFTFACRAYSSQEPEDFEVVYSSTTADLSAFKAFARYNNVNVTSWTSVSVEVPVDARYVGIRCISNDAFALLIDDLVYYTEDPANPTGYEIYLDGTKVKDAKVDELTYTFSDLSFGEHKVGVKAIYASGASELVEQTVNVSAEAMPINLNAEVDQRTAVLTWDMPEGFTPKSYKVFLGNDQKAENLTEKTYTFSDLANGTYTASVVAVYETGESEKASVEFIINSTVDVEDFDMAVRTKVYPNPGNGLFYLQAAAQGIAEVYTMNGQIIRRMEIPAEGVYAIDLQNRAKGMYLIRFVNNGQSSFFKVVVR